MVKVCIIGSGNLAQHLITAFANSDSTELVQVFSRDISKISHLIAPESSTNDYNALAEADVYIISVTDSAIAEVSKNFPFSNRFVVHTSGSLSVEALDARNRRGVFYPLQTFTKNKPVNFREIPICIEAENEADYKLLEQVAQAISNHMYRISSGQRKALHVAAVFVNNFTNHLYDIGNRICDENQIPFDILKPFFYKKHNNIWLLTPSQAKPGP
jgi:predicted short-subunit dehydrogenase-like oxidoreductase (DUF2520 family)